MIILYKIPLLLLTTPFSKMLMIQGYMNNQFMKNFIRGVTSLNNLMLINSRDKIKLRQFNGKMKYYKNYMNNHNTKILNMKILNVKASPLQNNSSNDYLKSFQKNN